jgi:hypothetical protein
MGCCLTAWGKSPSSSKLSSTSSRHPPGFDVARKAADASSMRQRRDLRPDRTAVRYRVIARPCRASRASDGLLQHGPNRRSVASDQPLSSRLDLHG